MKDFDIVVDDGKIFLREYTVTKSMPLTQFAKQLVQVEKSVETPFLPDNCIKFKSDGKTNEYYIHIPMGSYQIRYRPRSGNEKTLLITFPHQIMKFKFKTTNPNDTSRLQEKIVWCFDKQLPEFTKKRFNKPAMTNIHNNCSYCMARVPPSSTQVEYINNFVTTFFESLFNNDLSAGKRTFDIVAKDQEAAYNPSEDDNEIKLAKLWLKDVSMDFTETRTVAELTTDDGDEW